MSVEKAKTLLRSLRWHHLGFAFVWAITFAGLSAPDGFAGQRLFSLSDQLCALAAVGAAVLYERRRMPFPPRSALMVGMLLAAGSAAPEAGATALLQPQRAMTAVVDMVNARIKSKCFPFIFESPFMICDAGRRSEKPFCGTDVPHRKGCGRSFLPCAGGA